MSTSHGSRGRRRSTRAATNSAVTAVGENHLESIAIARLHSLVMPLSVSSEFSKDKITDEIMKFACNCPLIDNAILITLLITLEYHFISLSIQSLETSTAVRWRVDK